MAASIQLRLLPRATPQVRGLDVAGGARPALQVGGDFYDFHQLPNTPFLFAVGDVSGKGMAAALPMAMAHSVLHSALRHTPNATAAGVITYLNDGLYDDLTEVAMFATLFVAQYFAHDRQLVFANAGHSPVIYCPWGGTARLLEADGPPIGVLPTAASADYTIPLRVGDVLVAATDGFSEACSASGEMFGYTRLLRAVEHLADRSAAAIAEGLFAIVARFAEGHSQDDDQTLVVVKGRII